LKFLGRSLSREKFFLTAACCLCFVPVVSEEEEGYTAINKGRPRTMAMLYTDLGDRALRGAYRLMKYLEQKFPRRNSLTRRKRPCYSSSVKRKPKKPRY
jgi:hypothetical protein